MRRLFNQLLYYYIPQLQARGKVVAEAANPRLVYAEKIYMTACQIAGAIILLNERDIVKAV